MHQTLFHDPNRHRTLIDKDTAPAMLGRRFAESAATGEEIQQPIPGMGMHFDDALQQPKRLLRRVGGPFPRIGGDNSMPPNIRRSLS